MMRVAAMLSMGLFGCVCAQSVELAAPPTYSRAELATASESVSTAWSSWTASSRNFERDVLSATRAEGAQRVRKAYAAMSAYLEARRVYADAVTSYLRTHSDSNAAAARQITISQVSGDQLDLLGAQLSDLQARLASLRNTPEWISIRRGMQKGRDAISKLQDLRRERIPDTFRPGYSNDNRPMPASEYEVSEQEVRAAIQNLWSDYCQALLNAIYQYPNGSTSADAQLVARPSTEESATEGVGSGARSKSEARITGAWTYVENSHKFGGSGEPRHVVLELWVEGGQLVGRYRADVPDAGGMRHLDLKLSGKTAGRRTQSLEFRAADSPAMGTVTVQSNANGMELMFTRPPGNASVPAGHEVLTRR